MITRNRGPLLCHVRHGRWGTFRPEWLPSARSLPYNATVQKDIAAPLIHDCEGIDIHAKPRPAHATTSAWLPELDGIRAVAGLAVIVHHVQATWFLGIALANMGVALFFSLSGFLIYLIALQEYDRVGRLDLRRFFMRRILRIWPLYFVVITLGLILFGIPGFLPDPSSLQGLSTLEYLARYGYAIPLFMTNLAIAHNYQGGHFWVGPEYVAVTWSIAVEEQFYLLFPLLFIAAIRLGRRRVWTLAAAILALSISGQFWFVAQPVAFPTDAEIATRPELKSFAPNPGQAPVATAINNRGGLYYSSIAYSPIFLLGAMAGHLFHVRAKRERPWWTAALFVGSAAAIWWLMLAWAPLLWPPHSPFGVLIYSVMAVPLAGFIYASVSWSSAPWSFVFRAYPLRVLGLLSYSMYLVHFPVLRLVRRWHAGIRPSILLTPNADATVTLVYVIAATIAVSATLYVLVERPFLLLKFGRSRPQRAQELSSTTVPWLPCLVISLATMVILDLTYWRVLG